MQNFEFDSMFSMVKEHFPDMTAIDFYQAAIMAIEEKDDHSDQVSLEHDRLVAEYLWYKSGQPFYRISNDIVELFRHVSLDVMFEYVETPYPAFVVMFETDNPLRGDFSRQVRSMVVATHENVHGDNSMMIWADLGEVEIDPPYLPVLNGVALRMAEGKMVSSAIEKLQNEGLQNDLVANDLMAVLARIAISVCFLSTSSDKLIRPDVLSKDLAKWLEAARKGNGEQMKVIEQRARRRKGLGYVVSLERERQLIHAIGHSGGGTGEGHHELHFSYMRAGHFRRMQSGKVTFIRPTIVRPDLPSRS